MVRWKVPIVAGALALVHDLQVKPELNGQQVTVVEWVKAKSRLVILGFKDPQVLALERSAPTPTQEGFTATLQVLASCGFDAWSSDIKNAFG